MVNIYDHFNRVFPACCTAVAALVVIYSLISLEHVQSDLMELQQSHARLQRSCMVHPDIRPDFRPDSVTMKP